VYATGRYFDSVVQLVNETALPAPDAVICDVGTEIRAFPSGRPFGEWHERMPADWDTDRIRDLLSRLPRLRPQPSEWQSPLKASFFIENASSEEMDSVFESLWNQSIFPEVIYSSDRDLDVLPAGVNKGSAAAFLASCWGFAREDVVVSGDSGNDRPLFVKGFRGVVVANAKPELKELGGPLIYHARRPMAAGVLEGLKYWTAPPRLVPQSAFRRDKELAAASTKASGS
jgi:sucrose-6F-phosphate phosphohydrolase